MAALAQRIGWQQGCAVTPKPVHVSPHDPACCCCCRLALPAAVLITVPTDLVGAPLAWLHDVAIRVGEDLPAATGDPTTVNTLCKYTGAGALATKAGQEVRVECSAPARGRVATIQIRQGVELHSLHCYWARREPPAPSAGRQHPSSTCPKRAGDQHVRAPACAPAQERGHCQGLPHAGRGEGRGQRGA